MTCKQCANVDECKQNPAMHQKMLNIEFWENAEKSCGKFKEGEKCGKVHT